jgi:hypothetical protein
MSTFSPRAESMIDAGRGDTFHSAVSQRVISIHLSAGLMKPRPTSDGANEYVLTRKGRELGLVIMALTAWGDRWAADPLRTRGMRWRGARVNQLRGMRAVS